MLSKDDTLILFGLLTTLAVDWTTPPVASTSAFLKFVFTCVLSTSSCRSSKCCPPAFLVASRFCAIFPASVITPSFCSSSSANELTSSLATHRRRTLATELLWDGRSWSTSASTPGISTTDEQDLVLGESELARDAAAAP